MEEGWKDFFESYPDYGNIFTCVTVKKDARAISCQARACKFFECL